MSRRGRAEIVASLLLLLPLPLQLLLPAAARAQGFDVSGPWSIAMQAAPPVRAGGAAAAACTFQGTAGDTQTGSQFSGNIDVALASGPPTGCPASMAASQSGNVTGNQITMGAVMGGGLGQASFSGTLTPAAPVHPGSAVAGTARPAAPVNPGSTITGTFSVTSGPFTGTSGTWNATRLAAPAAAGIPALGARGLAILALLLLGTAVWLLRRRLATGNHRPAA
jgi:hypothetical protein